MALKFGVLTRNARLEAVETYIGTAPTLRIRSGSPPANAGSADTGDILATITLPSNWLADASGGEKEMAGTWQDAEADAEGVAGHFRIYKNGTCEIQGTVGQTGGSEDLLLNNVNIAPGQQVTITAFKITDGNA